MPLLMKSQTLRLTTATLILLLASSTWAVSPTSAGATGATTEFPITSFDLTGDVPIDRNEISAVLAPFIKDRATLSTLQQAVAALEAAFRAKGFALHRVSLPAQDLAGKVTLTVNRFVVGKVTVEGNTVFSQANVRASLPELREGDTPNFQTLAVQTAMANENPVKQVQVRISESPEADTIDAKVTVRDGKPWNLALGWANTGSDATGNDRLTLALSHANLFDRDQQLSAALTTSLERSDAVKQLGLNYRVPLYRFGAALDLSFTQSDVIGDFGVFSSTGAGQTYGVSYSWYRPPRGGDRDYWTVAIDEKRFDASKLNGVVVPGQSDRVSRPMSVKYTRRSESDAALWSASAELAVNLVGGGGTSLVAYQGEDQRIQTPNWRIFRAGLDYVAPLPSGWFWSAKAQMQLTNDALIAGEQFGVGGESSVRGVAERALTGDSGVVTKLEVTTVELSPGLRMLGFVDAAWLNSNNTSASTAGKLATDRVASAGLGLHFTRKNVSLSSAWGRVLTGTSQPSASDSTLPRAGDVRWHLSLTAHF